VKILLFSILVIATIGLIFPNVLSQTSDYSMSTYVHPEGKFSLQYPSTWIVEEYLDELIAPYLVIIDNENWTVQITIYDYGPIPFIDTQSEIDRYNGTMGGELLICSMATFEIDGYVCKDFQPNDLHGFLTLNSGEEVHHVEHYSVRQYDPQFSTGEDIPMITDIFDFMCCTNHVYSMEFIRDKTNPGNYDDEKLLDQQFEILESFSFSTTPNFIQTTELYSYEPTHVQDYPDNTKPPQYYLDRYNNEPNYQEWFDSQFPDRTIYDVVGLPNPVQIEPEPKVQKIPDWIKNTFAWYVQGQISEDEVLNAIKFLVNQGIIVLDD